MTATAEKAGTARGPAGEMPPFTVTLKILRFNPETDSAAHWESYQLTAHATDRVLDALHHVKWEQDGSLSFRRSCAHGICGSDAMRINGRNRTTSCPVFWNDGQYFGPAAIVNAHRFIFDSRDEGGAQRLEIVNDKEGVWRCRTTFNCTDACPRGIEVTKAIHEVKRALLTHKV